MVWNPADPFKTFWTGPEDIDPPYSGPDGAFPELYNLDCVAYESVMVGMFSWFYPGLGYDDYTRPGPILVELGVGFSRDVFNWVRPTRGGNANAFIPASNIAGTWDAYNTQSTGGGFLVVGDELWFYYSGRTLKKPADGVFSTGLARLRRDGFYSMNAGDAESTLLTRPVRFSGRNLFVNVSNRQGELRAEVLDFAGNPIPGYSKADSIPVHADQVTQAMRWQSGKDLSALSGQDVRFRFYLTNGELYSFWVSSSSNGESGGFVAGGGPTFSTDRDSAGVN
jgi:hypothetical protein